MKFWLHCTYFSGEQMSRYWAISVSRRLTFSLDISFQQDFTLKGQKRKVVWFWALQQPFPPMEKDLDTRDGYIFLSVFSFVFPFWFLMSLLAIFRGKHLFCGRHEARQLLLTLREGELVKKLTLSGVSLRCWWIGWQIQTGRLVSPTRSMMWKVN